MYHYLKNSNFTKNCVLKKLENKVVAKQLPLLMKNYIY